MNISEGSKTQKRRDLANTRTSEMPVSAVSPVEFLRLLWQQGAQGGQGHSLEPRWNPLRFAEDAVGVLCSIEHELTLDCRRKKRVQKKTCRAEYWTWLDHLWKVIECFPFLNLWVL